MNIPLIGRSIRLCASHRVRRFRIEGFEGFGEEGSSGMLLTFSDYIVLNGVNKGVFSSIEIPSKYVQCGRVDRRSKQQQCAGVQQIIDLECTKKKHCQLEYRVTNSSSL